MAWDCKLLISFCGLFGDVIRRADGENALVAADQERPFEEPAALVVEEILVPAIFAKLGKHANNESIGVLFRELENVLNDGNDDEAVGRWQSGELGRLGSSRAEGLLHVALHIRLSKFGMFGSLHVNGDDFRGEPRG